MTCFILLTQCSPVTHVSLSIQVMVAILMGDFILPRLHIYVETVTCIYFHWFRGIFLYPPHNEEYRIHSVRPSVCPSVVRPSRIPCPQCNAYSSGWIHFIFTHPIKQGVCRVLSFLAKFHNLNFWQFFFKFVTLTLLSFDLGSDVNH